MKRHQFLLGLIVFISLLFCQSCSFNRTYFEKVRLMTPADYRAMQIINQLQKKDVDVSVFRKGVINGDKDGLGFIRILMKNSDVFNNDSANFNANAYSILDRIVSLLNCYEEDLVSIQGGIGIKGKYIYDAKYSKALALDRAHRIAQYIWSQDVNATFFYATSVMVPQGYVVVEFQKFRRD